MSGTLLRALLPDPGLRLFLVDVGTAVAEAQHRHMLSPAATVPLGRALAGAALLAWDRKNGVRVTLQFRAEGPLGGLVADADPVGNLRGYVHHPTLQFPMQDVQRLAHAGLGCRGVLHCVRQVDGRQVQGQVTLATGGIDRDLEVLVQASDGERCAFGLGVFLASEPTGEDPAHHEGFRVSGAFGALLLALPDADPFAFDAVAARVRRLSDTPLTGDLNAVLGELAGPYPMELMEAGAVQFSCRCSTDTVTGVLAAIGAAEIEAMIKDPGYAEITCHFCNHSYRFEKEALQLLLDQSQPPIPGEPIGEA